VLGYFCDARGLASGQCFNIPGVRDTYTYTCRYAYAHTNTYTHTYTHTDCNSNAYADTNTNTHANADCDADAYTHAGSDNAAGAWLQSARPANGGPLLERGYVDQRRGLP
jgi:hypothetical protein